MAKSPAQLDAEIAEYLAGPGGDAELEGTPASLAKAKVLRKQAKIPRTGVKGGPLLGYTESGKSIHAPTRGAPDTNNVETFQRTRAKFPGWTRDDHMDAERLYIEASQAAQARGEGVQARRLRGWASVHWDIGGRWTGPQADARARARGLESVRE